MQNRAWSWHRVVDALREAPSRIDPLVIVVGGISLLVYSLHGIDGGLSRDRGLYSYAGQQFADGVPPYEGVFNRAGPLAHIIPGIGVGGARLFGVDELNAIRVLFMLISVACVCVIYLFARDLFGSPLAALSTAAAFLSFAGIIENASNGPREKTPMILFLLLAFWAAHRHRWIWAGAMLALATLALQIALPAGAAAILVLAIAAGPGQRLAAIVRTVVGGVATLAVFVLYFLVVGAAGDFVEAFFLVNLEYTSSDPFTANVAANWDDLAAGYRASVWVLLVGIVAILTVTAFAFSRRYRRGHPNAVPLAALGAATAVALVWTVREYDSWPDAMLLLPTAAFGVGVIADAVTEVLSLRWLRAAALAWVLLALVMATSYAVSDRHHMLVDQRAAVRAKLRHLPDDATILSINSPQALVLSGKTNAIPYQIFKPDLLEYIEDTWPGGLEGLAEDVEQDPPTLITVSGYIPQWLADTVERDYVRVGSAPGWVWYVDRSVGHRVVTLVRRAGGKRHRR
ncbi:glycosyltransferase family 39 protein [Solicola gregarius]|uniref:Glycosyltransferase family 39 protein n=1 Tax=Solicola gregarius TaxID=2908642 RepID=A0AA46TKF5_9ACTN|nr:glycosyltransferase family 39 protein [Solicola gregarius]UYM06969.1 glycosyltransferase family 39 protein [Solicola gregarius]